MNAYMNINVRVASAQAQAQIKALQARIAGLEAQLKTAGRASAGMGLFGAGQRKSMAAWGNQIQWTGRQLQYNWTIPIALAGAAATKFALDNEKAFTRIKKVYGDSADAAAQFNKEAGKTADAMYGQRKAAKVFNNELTALQESFEALSSRYGVAQKDVLETGSAWAAAGQSGVALAKSTELSIRAAVLGDMDLAKATDALISIQAQYSQSTKGLWLTLSELNAIENQTGISMQGLIDGFSRAAGVARESGIDVRHLGAMLAALVPATGSATTAGNALKTIISRLMSPTKDAADVMKAFGVDTASAVWQSSTAMERLEIVAGHMGDSLDKTADGGYKLSDSQKQVVASVLGSRYQMNRFLVLMRELDSDQGYYAKALNATSDRTKVFQQSTQELNAVLESNPQKLKIMWTTLQNGMADAIQPLIPYIIYLTEQIAKMVTWFGNLDPATQKLALAFLVLLAAVGPLTKYFGSLLTLIGTMIMPIKFLVRGYVAWATVTEVVNGATVTTRRSLLAMFGSMLLAPFKFFIGGLGAIAGAFLSLMGVQIKWAAVSSGLWSAVGASLRFGVTAFSTAATFMIAQTTAMMIAMSRAVIASPFIKSFSLLFGAIMFGMSYWVKEMLAAVGLFAFRFNIILAAGWSRAATLFETFQLAMLTLWSGFSQAFLKGWAGLYLAISSVMTAGATLIAKVWTGTMLAFQAITSFGSTALLRIWVAMQFALQTITLLLSRGLLKIWTVTMLALPQIMAISAKGIKAIWINLQAFMAFVASPMFKALLNPWTLAVLAIVAVIVALRHQIAQVWQNLVNYFADSSNEMTQAIIRSWNSLPAAISNALVAVARVVQQAALAIYHWFSYINPFARHSPSLVDNVIDGTRIIIDQFAGMSASVKRDVIGAYAALKTFGRATKGLMGKSNSVQEHQQRQQIAKYSPKSLGAFDRLSGKLKALQGDLARYQAQENRQQAVVDGWQRAVDKLNAALDRQQKKLDKLQKIESDWNDKLQAAQDTLSRFANAPIKGMQAMSDQIFANDQAQKQLQLDMMKMEDVTGPLDDIKSRLDAINGAQEVLRGDQSALRSAGAGSEILSFYDDQIKALDQQKTAQTGAAQALADMNTQLDELQRKGQMLDLQNSLQFDPLTRQIEQAANAMKELPFDQIMAGVQGAQVDIAKYTDKLDAATAAVAKQQTVVDSLTAHRDKLQAGLDRENKQLQKIKDNYDKVSDAIQAVQQAMSDAASAANDLAQAADKANKKAGAKGGPKGGAGYVSPALQNFRDARKGNFPIGGGDGLPMRTNWKDQTKQIQKFTDRVAKRAARAFDDINPFTALKEKWKEFEGWLQDRVSDLGGGLSDMFSHAFGGSGGGFGDFMDKIKEGWGNVTQWFQKQIVPTFKRIWGLIWPPVHKFLTNAGHGFRELWKQVAPQLSLLAEDLKGMGPALRGAWNIIKPILGLLAIAIGALISVIASVAARVIYPLLQTIGNVLENIIQVVRGVLEFLEGFLMLFSSNWREGLKLMWKGITNILSGLFGAVGQLIRGAVKIIFGLIWGLVEGVFNFFKWLYDQLIGHSIIPDIVNGMFEWFKKLAGLPKWFWTHVLKPLYDFVVDLWKKYIKPFISPWFTLWKKEWQGLIAIGKWLWDYGLKPTWDYVKLLWTDVKAELSKWWGNIKSVWNNLTGIGKWFKTNVMDKVHDAVVTGWNGIRDWLTKNKDMLGNAMKGMVNGIIGAVDTIINGLNKISDILPGPINWHINPIDKLASGGQMRQANRGFKTNGARAIVGEGKRNYPEFVIPTDPTYRNRAKMLMVQAAAKMGINPGVDLQGVAGDTAKDLANLARSNPKAAAGMLPQFGIGGWLSDTVHLSVNWFKDKAKDLISKAVSPALNAAQSTVMKIGWDAIKPPPLYAIDRMRSWISDANSQYTAAYDNAQDKINGGPAVRRAKRFAKSQVGKPYVWGGVGPGGYDCSGFMSAITNVLRGQRPYSRVGSTATFPWPGFTLGTNKKGFTIGSTNSYAGGVGHMAGTLAGLNVESHAGAGVVTGALARGYYDSGFNTRGFLPLKRGGIALASRGPTLAALGDGRYDEAVTPLPKGWRNGLISGTGGDTYYNFYGDLSFPNIKTGDDAKTFIDNLQDLTKD